ncbi:MAG: phenylalanine--tRNA ligase subunit alpha [Clostridia bacterium]|nr:phenylalanine--tRNA ligase subunit alpha [Clostridia bacterium]
MRDKLQEIERLAKEELSALMADAADKKEALENLRVKYLGKKGELTAVLRGMGGLSAEERPIVGQLANEVRASLETLIEQAKTQIEEYELNKKLKEEEIDVTIPGKHGEAGRLHPITQITKEMTDIFIGLGFEVVDGPEVEYDYYNFEKLNIPKNHPARDTQDTFYINEEIVLRTQTSPVQVRVMETRKPPIRIVSPGRVYRSDAVDATHSPLFHQMEGLVIDKGITMTDLKGTLELFAKKLYGEDAKIRLRPHHFNFTEPSAEVDVCCFSCGGKGCRLCKGEGWIEILGAGMVHPKVLMGCGIDPDEYSGFAFGMGIERIVMRRYGIKDLRLLFENDVRFLKQF